MPFSRDSVAGPCSVEIQALVDQAHGNRDTGGRPRPRSARPCCSPLLHRHAGIACFDQDVFINAVGGVRINEPAADLAVLLAIVSSLKNKALPNKLTVFGEVGLAGEIRPAPRGRRAIRPKPPSWASRTPSCRPPAGRARRSPASRCCGVARIAEAVEALRNFA